MPKRARFWTKPIAAVALATSLAAGLAACAGPPAPQATSRTAVRDAAPLRLETFFLGRASGRGVFRPTLTGAPRAFTVRFAGRMRGDTLILDEDIRYADGARERKRWRLTPTAQGYRGLRDDVVGVAEGRRDGRDVLLAYETRIGDGPSPTLVRFDDRLTPTAPGVVLNRAVVSKFGVKVGEVEILIRK